MGRRGYKIAVFINRYGKPCILRTRNREGYPEFCINCTTSNHCPVAGLEQAVNAPARRVNSMHLRSGASEQHAPDIGRIGACNGTDGAPCALRILRPQALICPEQRTRVMFACITLPPRCRACVQLPHCVNASPPTSVLQLP